FREDLFFRVNTFEVPLPPLRERREDIADLARTLIARHLRRARVPEGFLPDSVIAVLKQHDWSGNVRELANALEHAVILSDGQSLAVEDLPTSVTQRPRKLRVHGDATEAERPKTLREIEMEVILQTLEKNSGDKPRTAIELGIALKTLYNKLNQHQTHAEAG
ncbi:MAG: sigma-54-dependent Fis family transcriptional regulator, partial [Planctomycetia bacterium]|nr:sigma-54-dependent Fis family transcriptional regulator [Planctomycetia bacterium]